PLPRRHLISTPLQQVRHSIAPHFQNGFTSGIFWVLRPVEQNQPFAERPAASGRLLGKNQAHQTRHRDDSDQEHVNSRFAHNATIARPKAQSRLNAENMPRLRSLVVSWAALTINVSLL